jgi:hypothetical protein
MARMRISVSVRESYVLLLVFFDQFLETRGIGSHETIDDFAALDKDKGRHGTDIVLGSRVRILVHIYLEKDHVLHLLAQFGKDGPNDFARSAPGGGEINHHEFLLGRGLENGRFHVGQGSRFRHGAAANRSEDVGRQALGHAKGRGHKGGPVFQCATGRRRRRNRQGARRWCDCLGGCLDRHGGRDHPRR